MSDIVDKLTALKESDSASYEIVGDAIEEIKELRKVRDTLEEILIILARTPLPWDEDDQLTEGFPLFKERYINAMHEASHLLGLDLRSMITRTEPRT
ncbi:MAG TPA: hypothetical protein VJ550_15745 [Geomonas sp.]|nr:hypothetical protein [Geomonas sp.]